MTRRAGMTLVETLVAIFIMAIGLLALLTLFPLGALNMAQAIKDQRVAEAGRNGGAIADITWEYSTAAGAPSPPTAPYFWTMRSDPGVQNAMVNPGTPPGFANPLPNLTGSTTPSYPVLVDPIGYQLLGGWVATQAPNYSGLPRTTMRILRPIPPTDPLGVDPNMNPLNAGFTTYRTKQVYRWTTLLDDITFDENGVPDQSTGNVQREGRYSWAWLVQAPAATAGTGPQPVVSLKVLVFSGRSLDLNSGTLSAQGENSYVADFGTDSGGNTNLRVIRIQWGPAQPRPSLVANSWVLDGTMQPTPSSYVYRVLNVTDTGIDPNTGNSQMDVEVQTDVKYKGTGYVIVFDNLVEVIDRLTQ